jgi:hypothetical protein
VLYGLSSIVYRKGCFTKMSAPKGNEFAKKSEDQKLTATLYIRCTKEEKSAWVKAAKPLSVREWAVSLLNNAAFPPEIPEIKDSDLL